jgi:hypothetical protein
MPAQQGLRLDEEASRATTEEQSPQGGEHSPVGRLKHRAVDLSSEHRHLVAQHDDFDRQIGVRTAREPYQLEDADERPVQK